uniref:uncharacterized protein isoform X3 n=1 Tax=Semicossyphus pulcher TaxID=241346 RepID=UPI0037E7A73C
MKVPVMMASYLSHTQQGESSADNAEVPAGHAQGDSGVAAPFGRPGPIDIYLQSRAAGPTQPRLKMYPKTMQGKKRRSFNPSWRSCSHFMTPLHKSVPHWCHPYQKCLDPPLLSMCPDLHTSSTQLQDLNLCNPASL